MSPCSCRRPVELSSEHLETVHHRLYDRDTVLTIYYEQSARSAEEPGEL
jgi:hypothetical protein